MWITEPLVNFMSLLLSLLEVLPEIQIFSFLFIPSFFPTFPHHSGSSCESPSKEKNLQCLPKGGTSTGLLQALLKVYFRGEITFLTTFHPGSHEVPCLKGAQLSLWRLYLSGSAPEALCKAYGLSILVIFSKVQREVYACPITTMRQCSWYRKASGQPWI